MLAPLVVLACLALVPFDGDGDEEERTPPPTSVTEHVVALPSGELRYRASAGTLRLTEEDGTPRADVFHVLYTVGDGGSGDGGPERPLTFCFNGGPGSSSVWLHLGLFGPHRVRMADAGEPPLGPPWGWTPNEWTLLRETDLVFVDPPTTGYSRAAGDTEPGTFHGVDEDVRWMAEFVRLFVTRHGRWDSPKVLAGESYGTTRVAGLARELQDRHGMYLDGVVLVSAILDFQTARFDVGNDLPYALFLPTYTATAFYHGRLAGRLAEDLERTLDEAEAFAAGPYRDALFAGDRLGEEERLSVASRLAAFTGLSVDYCLACDLRPNIQRFCKELLRDRAVTVGRLDSRFTGRDRDASREAPEYDPSYAAIQGPYTAALNAYVREELGYESDLPYEILSGRVHPWNWVDGDHGYVATSEALRGAMTKNPSLRVFVASGRFDLATPYWATEYTLAHMGLPADLRANVRVVDYAAGHMMYVHPPSLARLHDDLVAFYRDATGR